MLKLYVIFDDKKLDTLRDNARQLGKPNASKDIYDLICQLVKK